MKRIPLGIVILLLAWPRVAGAELRRSYEDKTVVERAELIVIARILPETIVRVEHELEPGRRDISWEHHATLLVSEVLKGSYDQEELPMVFDYGLGPSIGRAPWKTHDGRDPATVVEIRGNSAVSIEPLIADAREDTLWMLRRETGSKKKHSSGLGRYRVRDPEDVRPASSRDMVLAYLAEDEEEAIRQLVAEGVSGPASRRFLDRAEIERIRRIEDLEERFELLLPYFLDLAQWDSRWIAKDAMTECGDVCAKGLEPVFRSLELGRARQQIMRIWADLEYEAAAPLLIEALEEAELFWAGEELTEGWWNRDHTSAKTRQRREVYGDMHSALYALSRMADPAARPILEATRDRWRMLENDQITETAEWALGRLDP